MTCRLREIFAVSGLPVGVTLKAQLMTLCARIGFTPPVLLRA